MSLTNPPSHPPVAPPVPNRRTDGQAEFDTKADAYLNWMVTFAAWLSTLVGWLAGFVRQLGPYMQGVLTAVEAHKKAAQVSAAAAEASARQAALIAGAKRWQVGTYAQGDVVWSPLSLLTYRRVPNGTTASGTDPSLDPVGWRLTGTTYSMPQTVLGSAGPHQLVVGMHYIITAPDCVASLPRTPAYQEQLRITNLSGSAGLVLQRNGQTFKGHATDLRLPERMDYTFTFTPTHGWI